MYGRRQILKAFGLAAVATTVDARGVVEAATGSFDEVSLPPHDMGHLFGKPLVPYSPSERMMARIRMLRGMPRATDTWHPLVNRFKTMDRLKQVRAVNDFVNKVPYVTDRENYGVEDRWASVQEFFLRGGDCEDAALAKYALLGHLGFHPNRMSIAAIQRVRDGMGHAVMVLNMKNRNFILDQMEKQVAPDSEYTGFRLVYSVCSTGVHVPGPGVA